MTDTINSYFQALQLAIQLISHTSINQAVSILKEARERDAQVFTFGNGGSAATAIHFANDLVKMAGMRAQALTNISILTAYANDKEYNECFEEPLRVLIKEGDVAFGISCSGRSANVVKALVYAKGRGNKTIALTGNNRRSNPIVRIADAYVHVPYESVKIQEDLHLAICHCIAGALK